MEYRLLLNTDARLLLEYFKGNREHFKRWDPIRSEGYYRLEYWEKFVSSTVIDQEEGRSAFFVAFDNTENVVVAHCSLSQIFYGAFRACYMGFAVAATHEGQGIASQLCRTAIDHAFNKLSLNRIMANYMPHNNRSANLIYRLGFHREGLAKDYLKINGQWQHHVLTSLTNPKCT